MQTGDQHPDTDQQMLAQLRQQLEELQSQNEQLRQQLSRQPHDNQSYQRSMQSLEQVDEIIQQSVDLEQLMEEFLQATLKIFGTDRAWLLYPCDPTAASWQVLMECTTSEYPGAFALKTDLPMNAESRGVFQCALESRGPVVYDLQGPNPLPEKSAEQFSIQSQITLAIYPRTGKPWLFGMHQCSHPRVWTAGECRLFEQLGRRLPEGFDTFLTIRRLEESEWKYRSLVANLPGVVYRCQNDEQFTMTYLSETIEELSGYPAADFINNRHRSFASIIHPDDRQRVAEEVQRALEQKNFYEFEYRLQTRKGEARWVYERGQAIYPEAGNLKYRDGLIIDMTSSKAAKHFPTDP